MRSGDNLVIAKFFQIIFQMYSMELQNCHGILTGQGSNKFRDRCAICGTKIPDGEFSDPLIKGREFIFVSTYSFMRKTLLFSKQVTSQPFIIPGLKTSLNIPPVS